MKVHLGETVVQLFGIEVVKTLHDFPLVVHDLKVEDQIEK